MLRNHTLAGMTPPFGGCHCPHPIDLVPNGFGDRLREAKRLINLQDYDPAAKKIVEALRLDEETADAHNLRGVLHEICGDLNGARKAYQRAIRLNPKHDAARQNMRRIAELFKVGRSEESLHLWR